MRLFNYFRFIFLATFIVYGISINAQTNDNFTVKPEMTKGDNSKADVIKGVNHIYGVTGAKLSTDINYTPPSIPDEKFLSGTTLYRVCNRDTVEINNKTTDIITPEDGKNQTLQYIAILEIKDKKTNKETTDTIRSNEFIFSIYTSDNSIITLTQPEGAQKNVYAGREYGVSYKLDVDSIGKAIPAYQIDWINSDNKDVVKKNSDSYELLLSNLNISEKTTYTFKSIIKFLKPESNGEVGENEQNVWFTNELTSDSLTVYLNPNNSEISEGNYTYPEKNGQKLYSHTGQGDRNRKYEITIKQSSEYGRWIYEWKIKKDGSDYDQSSTSSVEIKNNVSEGSYETFLTLKCVNPNDDNDIWLKNEDIYKPTFGKYIVYKKPNCISLDEHVSDYKENDSEYAMFDNNKGYNTKKLYKLDGGYDIGWKDSVFIRKTGEEKWDHLSSFVFNPNDTNKYELKVVAVNYSPDNSETWYKYEKNYSFIVYDTPSNDVTIRIRNKNSSGIVNFSEEYDIVEKDTIQFDIKYNGGDESYWRLDKNEVTDFLIIRDEHTNDNNSFLLELAGARIPHSYDKKNVTRLSFSVSNTPPNIIKEYEYKNTYEFNINQWKDLTITFENTEILESQELNNDIVHYVIETCEGLNNNAEEVRLKPIGGDYYDWTADWIPENSSDPTLKGLVGQRLPADKYYSKWDTVIVARFDKENSLKADDSTPRTYHYIVNTYYKKNSKPKQTFHVDIITYPKPVLRNVLAGLRNKAIHYYDQNERNRIKADCYEGDEIQLKCDISGGLPGSPSGWEYSLYDNEAEAMSNDSTISFTSNYSGNLKIYYRHSGNYYTSNPIWFESDEYNLNFNYYPIPKLTPELKDSVENVKWGEQIIDVYAGNYPGLNDVVLKFKSDNGGYPKGWTYTWNVDNNTETTSDSVYSYEPIVTTNKDYEEKVITVHVKNSIGENEGFKGEYYYPIRVWRKAEFRDFILKDSTQNNRIMGNDSYVIREGNLLKGYVPAIQYGYSNNNTYQWTGAYTESECVEWSDIARNDKSDHTKAYESLTYNLRMTNKGPYGNVWDAKTFSHNVMVYNKPATPTSIVQKGNGSSRTMIATADVSDQDLQERDYFLVFGYTDTDGVDHDFSSKQQMTPGQVRWSTQFANQQQMSNAYVYAVWKYDSAEITSGKCMLTGIDEDYDSSTYNGTTRAAIEGDEVDVVETISNMNSVRNVYNLNGIHISSTLSGLKPGLYIVEYADGVTNKVNVK